MSNSVDPNKARQNIRSGLGTNCFHRLSADDNSRRRINVVYEPVHEISNNVVCVASKASEQPAHKHSLIRASASRLSIL